MAELAGDVVAPAQHLAVDHHADADAVRDADEHEVAGQAADVVAHRPRLRQRAGAAGVLDLHRQAGRRGERLAEIDVAPAERRRVQHAHRRVLDHAGHDDADTFAGIDLRVIGEQRLDARGQQRHLLLRIARRSESRSTPVIGLPSRSASITKVSLARMSAATTARRRESM